MKTLIRHFLLSVSIFLVVNIAVIFYLAKKTSRRKAYFSFEREALQEKINTINNRLKNSGDIYNALGQKIIRYDNLKNITQELSQSLSLDTICQDIAEFTFSLIASNKGTCLLYLIDTKNQNLSLFASRKENKELVIKAKEGDIFDRWVLRHASALLVEDISKDFRFDLEKIQEEHLRPFYSLISAPLISQDKMLGIIRLDSMETAGYTQDDLRFLTTISELGAVALENATLFQRTQELAIKDSLTALYTKGYFMDRLAEEFKRSVYQNVPLALLMIDIDHFKEYNDKFGHTAGDIILKEISFLISNFLKKQHTIACRFGGEEFCLLLCEVDKKSAVKHADELRALIEEKKIVLRRQKMNVTVSIGIAAFPQDCRNEEELVYNADSALYQAKQKGRNKAVGF
ncbi:MAG: sensor domain-containing diguanylate cyclase [Candidatus Omnitrophica bacterium]|nr:sensor domain-containing diguanylate cyclase [Candidatus Omnitrophota bacterium]